MLPVIRKRLGKTFSYLFFSARLVSLWLLFLAVEVVDHGRVYEYINEFFKLDVGLRKKYGISRVDEDETHLAVVLELDDIALDNAFVSIQLICRKLFPCLAAILGHCDVHFKIISRISTPSYHFHMHTKIGAIIASLSMIVLLFLLLL